MKQLPESKECDAKGIEPSQECEGKDRVRSVQQCFLTSSLLQCFGTDLLLQCVLVLAFSSGVNRAKVLCTASNV